ncbi:Transcriptional regulatory protein ZraR [Candidatus Magnetaquicoccaceae bacterium FCR-1]|uniref:Transcriptional regulatory protein ZraR n=1 Tax=Candidatus Magnetaquiglobus chichijimensis TaxID=3141448 RepID=A0ABQ0C5K0_9PROT
MSEAAQILIVDRDKMAVQNLEHILRKEGHPVAVAPGSAAALRYLEESSRGTGRMVQVILADLGLDPMDANQFLRRCLRLCPACALILISDTVSVNSVVEAMRLGAFHYLIKPIRPQELREAITHAFARRVADGEVRAKPSPTQGRSLATSLITRDPAMLKILEQATISASLELPVLITGETGTGKEILAKYLHDMGNRAAQPFVAINCGAFQEELLTNELFGHAREAFTGAVRDRKGLLETAHGGTVFLDEITEMSLSMQVKLLRVIQEKELLRLGSTRPVSVDVRFMAASNRDVRAAVEAGQFRRDLYYRLNVIEFHLPPLSCRLGDLPLLAQHFIDKHAKALQRSVTGISRTALERLSGHPFHGNIRELENMILRAVAFAPGDQVEVSDLPTLEKSAPVGMFASLQEGAYPSLEQMERDYILWVCEQLQGNQGEAARVLGMDRVSLWRRLKKIHGRSEPVPRLDGA